MASQIILSHHLVALRALGGEVLAVGLAAFDIGGSSSLHLLRVSVLTF